MGTYAEALAEFYNGEVIGEAVYSCLLARAEGDTQRLKLATLLQLETETKAWLRPHALAAGVSIAERAVDREEGAKVAGQLATLSWTRMWKAIHHGVAEQIMPRFRQLADEARARGVASEVALCEYMVEHEAAQVEFARRELEGADATACLAPVVKHLRYPFAA